jgi:hypothetical protein
MRRRMRTRREISRGEKVSNFFVCAPNNEPPLAPSTHLKGNKVGEEMRRREEQEETTRWVTKQHRRVRR